MTYLAKADGPEALLAKPLGHAGEVATDVSPVAVEIPHARRVWAPGGQQRGARATADGVLNVVLVKDRRSSS